MTVSVRESTTRDHASAALGRLIGAIGDDGFGPTLAQYLYGLCGADHFAAFSMGRDELREVAACCIEPERTARTHVESYVKQGLWRRDPAMTEAQRCLPGSTPGIIRVDFSGDGYTELRPRIYPHVRDRLLLCGHGTSGAFGLSLIRLDPHAPFASDAIDHVASQAELLMSVVAKHADIRQSRPNVADALTSLGEIEACIVATSDLPRREAEVCARILNGISSVGIALHLSVSEETVKTYRKRAYRRLAIGSERELLTWYLARWSSWRGQRLQAGAGTPIH